MAYLSFNVKESGKVLLFPRLESDQTKFNHTYRVTPLPMPSKID